jgi:DNA-binding transcriptional regulator YbjK
LEAAMRRIAVEGAGGVTLRAVAEEAGVPLAATSYYFASKEELLHEAFRVLAERMCAALDDLADSIPERLTVEQAVRVYSRTLAQKLTLSREEVLGGHELALQAARTAELQPIARSWESAHYRVLTKVFKAMGSTTPELDAKAMRAVLQGLVFADLITPHADVERDVIQPVIRRVMTALVGASGAESPELTAQQDATT